MRKKLISILLSLLCTFLLTDSLVAETRLATDSSNEAIKNFNSFESLKFNVSDLGRKLKSKSRYSNQNCQFFRDNCDDAYTHLQNVAEQISTDCTTAGWESDYCGELIQWGFDTMDWVDDVCANYTY